MFGWGTLYISPRPQCEELTDWCNSARAAGVDHVVSLLAEEEVQAHDLTGESVALTAAGISFEQFPVEDFGVPDGCEFPGFAARLHKLLQTGECVLAHCAGGIGRAGTLASCLLVIDGVEADEAMRIVSAARGAIVPESDIQRQFIRGFSRSRNAKI